MKKTIIVSNIIFFVALVVMTYFKYFGPTALVLSLACFVLPIISSGLTKKKILMVAYTVEAIISMFLFLGNGPFALDWLSGGISFLHVGLTWVCQIFFLMFVLGIIIKNYARIDKMNSANA